MPKCLTFGHFSGKVGLEPTASASATVQAAAPGRECPPARDSDPARDGTIRERAAGRAV